MNDKYGDKWQAKKRRKERYAICPSDIVLAAFCVLISVGAIGAIAELFGFTEIASVASLILRFFDVSTWSSMI